MITIKLQILWRSQIEGLLFLTLNISRGERQVVLQLYTPMWIETLKITEINQLQCQVIEEVHLWNYQEMKHEARQAWIFILINNREET